MARRLVVCCDGTWNVPDPAGGTPTNVVKIALNVAPAGEDGVEQRVFYDPGVGTGRFDRLLGGAFGVGLSDNVRDAYRFLVDNAEPDDQLYLFGFSRGAFTARSLGGLIRNCGVLRREHAHRVDEAYRLYRDRHPRAGFDGIGAELFRRTYSHEMGIRLIGVFDTVGALGVPTLTGPLGSVLNSPWQFHDTDLGPSVENAFQALAMDERRGPFVPTPWTGEAAVGQRVEQLWFRGDHSDIGGGHEESALAEVTLQWMVDRARTCDLAFRKGTLVTADGADPDDRRRGTAIDPDPLGTVHDSSTGFFGLLPAHERRSGDRYGPAGAPAVHESLAPEVLARARARPDEPVPPGFRDELSRTPGPPSAQASSSAGRS